MRCRKLFFLNEHKILPERDLMNPKSPLQSWEPMRILNDILGKWYYCFDDILGSKFFVKHILSNKFELWQILLGAEMGNGVYKIRALDLNRDKGTIVMRLNDYDQIKEVGDLSKFKRWMQKYGLSASEIDQYAQGIGNETIESIVITF